jgi:hypothetical protein
MLCVCLGDCGLPLPLFQVDIRVLVFIPHHVNQGGVQKTTPQVTLYKLDTGKESLRRRRAGKQKYLYLRQQFIPLNGSNKK